MRSHRLAGWLAGPLVVRTVALVAAALLTVPVTARAQDRDSGDVEQDLGSTADEAAALEDALGELRGEVGDAEAELAATGLRLDEARGRLRQARGQVALAERALDEARDERDEAAEEHERAEIELERTEEELALEEAVFTDQVVETYKYGAAGAARGAMVLELLRRAEDPNAFAVGLENLRVVVDEQNSTVEAVFALREEREQLTEQAARSRARASQTAADAADTLETVEDLRAEARAFEADVEREREQQRSLVASLRSDESETESLLAQASTRQRALESELSEVRAAERARQRARETARVAELGREPRGPVGSGTCPVRGASSYDFSNDWGNPRSGGRRHEGTDIFASRGTAVVAVDDATVVSVQRSDSGLGGLSVSYRTGDGVEWYGAHMDSVESSISPGDRVARGDVLGTVGDSGNARGTPPHLHVGRYQDGATNPYPYLVEWCG